MRLLTSRSSFLVRTLDLGFRVGPLGMGFQVAPLGMSFRFGLSILDFLTRVGVCTCKALSQNHFLNNYQINSLYLPFELLIY